MKILSGIADKLVCILKFLLIGLIIPWMIFCKQHVYEKLQMYVQSFAQIVL